MHPPAASQDRRPREASADLPAAHLVVLGEAPPQAAQPTAEQLAASVARGLAFRLAPPGPPGGWRIGRAADAEVRLAGDAYVSAAHARVLHVEGRFVLRDEPSRRSLSFLNWRRLEAGHAIPLAQGDLLGVGMTLLRFVR